jgi:hypothetical protein
VISQVGDGRAGHATVIAVKGAIGIDLDLDAPGHFDIGGEASEMKQTKGHSHAEALQKLLGHNLIQQYSGLDTHAGPVPKRLQAHDAVLLRELTATMTRG